MGEEPLAPVTCGEVQVEAPLVSGAPTDDAVIAAINAALDAAAVGWRA
jgi:hypothetical protein